MRFLLSLTAVVVGLAVMAMTPDADAAALHFQLDHANPADGSTVSSPAAVVLWFTQVPQDDATTIRVLDPSGEPVPAHDLVQDPELREVFTLPLGAVLADGSYTVSWRSMAADGHVIREEFGFSVAAAR